MEDQAEYKTIKCEDCQRYYPANIMDTVDGITLCEDCLAKRLTMRMSNENTTDFTEM